MLKMLKNILFVFKTKPLKNITSYVRLCIPQFFISYMKKVLRYSYYGYGGITIKQMLKFIGISSDDSYVLLRLHLKFSLYYISDNVSIIRQQIHSLNINEVYVIHSMTAIFVIENTTQNTLKI